MLNVVKTIYNVDLMLAMLKGENYTPLKNTVLNEKFDILKNDIVLRNEYPSLKYLAIGNGGLPVTDNNSIMLNSQHTAKDGALFSHIPFIVREYENDIPNTEKLKYRFRLSFIKDDKTYVAYYLKLIDNVGTPNSILNIKSVEDSIGKHTVTPFNNDDVLILNPIPKKISERQRTNKEYLVKSSEIDISLSVDEIKEIKKSYGIMTGGNLEYITELGLCTGVDRYNGLYYEASNVQVNFFISTGYKINENINNNKPIYENIDVGGMEPLIITEDG